MKASIDANGTLTVAAETELEAYALTKWSDDHMSKDEEAAKRARLLLLCRAAPAHLGEGEKEGK